MMRDLVGKTYGRMTVLRFNSRRANGHILWDCRCLCGAEKTVRGSSLISGHAKSCGCFQKDASRVKKIKHGHSKRSGGTKEYRTWIAMRNRCTRKADIQYKDYGGRGITVCERWQKFENFLADMGPKPSPELSIDRINNDGNYEPGNCRWATAIQQARNTRPYIARHGKPLGC